MSRALSLCGLESEPAHRKARFEPHPRSLSKPTFSEMLEARRFSRAEAIKGFRSTVVRVLTGVRHPRDACSLDRPTEPAARADTHLEGSVALNWA